MKSLKLLTKQAVEELCSNLKIVKISKIHDFGFMLCQDLNQLYEIETGWKNWCNNYSIDMNLGVLIDISIFQKNMATQNMKNNLMGLVQKSETAQVLDCLRQFQSIEIKQYQGSFLNIVIQNVILQTLEEIKTLSEFRTEQIMKVVKALCSLLKKTEKLHKNKIGYENSWHIINRNCQYDTQLGYQNIQLIHKNQKIDKQIYFKSQIIESFNMGKIVKQMFAVNQLCSNMPWQENIITDKIQKVIQIWSLLLEQKEKIFCIDDNSILQTYTDFKENTILLEAETCSLKCLFFSFDPLVYIFLKLAGFQNIFNTYQLQIKDEILSFMPQQHINAVESVQSGMIREYCSQTDELTKLYNKLAQKMEFYLRIKNEFTRKYLKYHIAEPEAEKDLFFSQSVIKQLYLP